MMTGRRLVKVEDGVVTEAIITESVTPWVLDASWHDVTTKSYAGQPVSIGWTYDGLLWLPPT